MDQLSKFQKTFKSSEQNTKTKKNKNKNKNKKGKTCPALKNGKLISRAKR